MNDLIKHDYSFEIFNFEIALDEILSCNNRIQLNKTFNFEIALDEILSCNNRIQLNDYSLYSIMYSYLTHNSL